MLLISLSTEGEMSFFPILTCRRWMERDAIVCEDPISYQCQGEGKVSYRVRSHQSCVLEAHMHE